MEAYIKAARLQVHAASILPACVGSTYGFYVTGHFDILLFVLTVLGVALIHAGSNMINDYYDYQTGTDQLNQTFLEGFSGGSRVLLSGAITPKALRNAAWLCFGLGALVGLVITAKTGWPVLLIGIFGITTSILYVWPKFSLTDKGLGELVVGIDFGVLIVLGAFYVQTGMFTWGALWVSIPLAMTVASILMINQLPDYESDRQTGKMTSAVRMGRSGSASFLIRMLVLAAVITGAAVLSGILPWRGLLMVLILPIVFKTAQELKVKSQSPDSLLPSALGVIQCHVLISLFLLVSLIPGIPGLLLTLLPLGLCMKAYKELQVEVKGWIS